MHEVAVLIRYYTHITSVFSIKSTIDFICEINVQVINIIKSITYA